MSWGLTPWGLFPWGTGDTTPLTLPPPTLIAVSSLPGPTAPATSPAVVDELGGTICIVVGTNFTDPITIDFLTGASGGPYTVVANGYLFDPQFDLLRTKATFGAPGLIRGLYHLRVTTAGGTSNVLENVLAARAFSDEFKTVAARGKFHSKWKTGPRILRG